jgi:hypothetical protein
MCRYVRGSIRLLVHTQSFTSLGRTSCYLLCYHLCLMMILCSVLIFHSIRIHRRSHRRICWPSWKLLLPPSPTTWPGSVSMSAAPLAGSSADRHTKGRQASSSDKVVIMDTILYQYTIRRISCFPLIHLSLKEQVAQADPRIC